MKRALNSGALIAILALGAACSGGGALGADNPRTAKFKSIAKANKAIGEELKKDVPSIDVIKTNASALDSYAAQLPGWFPGASGPEKGIDTEAKAEIWQNPAQFKAAADKFAAATAALQQAASAGDLAAVKTAAAAVGPTCKSCHDSFRRKK